MASPKVSIGLPVYNGEKYLSQTLDSLQAQTFEDFELIISDNASTDGTADICRSYAAKDSRIRYYRNASNIGSAQNYRRTLELARGDFFKWCSHDDVCHPSFLSRCLDVFASAPPSVVLVYPQCNLIDGFGNVLGRASDCVETTNPRPHHRLAQVLRNLSYVYPIWGLIRAASLRKTQLSGFVWYWDAVLLAELSLYGDIREIPEVLSQQRSHKDNALGICSAGQGSIVANNPNNVNRRTRRSLLTWTDPARANKKIWLPYHEERYWEYTKRVYHAPLPPFERLLCYLTVPIVCYWCRIRKIGGEWKRKLRGTLLNAPGHRRTRGE